MVVSCRARPSTARLVHMRGGWVYIMTNRPDGTLYIGVTSDLAHRAWQHRTGTIPGFTKKTLWIEAPRLGRAARGHPLGDPAGKGSEGMAAGLESPADPRRQSGVAGPHRSTCVKSKAPAPPPPRHAKPWAWHPRVCQ